MDSLLKNPELPEALLLSKKQSAIADVVFEWCQPEDVLAPYHELLVHERDMTSALERFHDQAIALEIRQAGQNTGSYFREVVLFGTETKEPVEYGLIEIDLEAFETELRAQIVEGVQPLGGLLNEAGLKYGSAPLGFFRVASESLNGIFSASSGGADLFGRYNQLIAEGGTILARIIEILPAISEQ